jgi:hypothetical protein
MQPVSGQGRGGLVTRHYCLIWDHRVLVSWISKPCSFGESPTFPKNKSLPSSGRNGWYKTETNRSRRQSGLAVPVGSVLDDSDAFLLSFYWPCSHSFLPTFMNRRRHAEAQWLTHCATSRKARRGKWITSIYLSLLVAPDPGVHSAANIN